MALRALIFDVDGTLANTERDGHRPALPLAPAAALERPIHESQLHPATNLDRKSVV